MVLLIFCTSMNVSDLLVLHETIQDSAPRIVKLGDHPGCPCGGTHVADIADIRNLTVRLPWFLLI